MQSDRNPQVLTVGSPNMPQTNTRWRTAAILKNRKIWISSQPIDQFWRNLARWCVSTLSTPIANKILWFQKSKMAAAAIFENLNNRYISAMEWPIVMPFTTMMSLKIQDGSSAAILTNWKILISLQPIDRFWWYLACWCDSTLWTPFADKILQFQKSKMVAMAIWKIEKSQYLCFRWRDGG